jgi:serine phosphatase RsbU (regulator of sigma subunit)
MQEGDTLIFASDGTTDATDSRGELYDPCRFTDSIRSHASEAVSDLAKNLYLGVSRFTGRAELSDDVTILALRRLKQG